MKHVSNKFRDNFGLNPTSRQQKIQAARSIPKTNNSPEAKNAQMDAAILVVQNWEKVCTQGSGGQPVIYENRSGKKYLTTEKKTFPSSLSQKLLP